MLYGIKKKNSSKLTSYKLHQESFDAHLYLDDNGWC
jgi:RNA:NAD 2'-phosphotransferase (TPT1/KptA family)